MRPDQATSSNEHNLLKDSKRDDYGEDEELRRIFRCPAQKPSDSSALRLSANAGVVSLL